MVVVGFSYEFSPLDKTKGLSSVGSKMAARGQIVPISLRRMKNVGQVQVDGPANCGSSRNARSVQLCSSADFAETQTAPPSPVYASFLAIPFADCLTLNNSLFCLTKARPTFPSGNSPKHAGIFTRVAWTRASTSCLQHGLSSTSTILRLLKVSFTSKCRTPHQHAQHSRDYLRNGPCNS